MKTMVDRKRLIIDVDGVLADFVSAWVRTTAELTGLEISPDPQCWDWFRGHVSKKQEALIWAHIKASPDWWLNVPVLIDDGTTRRLQEFDDRHDLYFVTSRVGLTARSQTEAWLRRHFDMDNPTVVISGHKGDIAVGIAAHAAIDDKLEHVCEIDVRTGTKTASFLLDRPYNQGPVTPGVVRVRSLLEFFNGVDRL